MGYLDAVTSSYLRTGKDGRRLFYPWGAMGRGYVVPTEDEFEGLRRIARIGTAAFLVLVIASAALQMYLATLVIGAGFALFQVIWTRGLVRRLEPSAEKLSVRDTLSTQAFTHNIVTLWVLEFLSLGFVAAGIFLLVRDGANWPIALLSIALFAPGAGVFVFMLVLRKRVTP